MWRKRLFAVPVVVSMVVATTAHAEIAGLAELIGVKPTEMALFVQMAEHMREMAEYTSDVLEYSRKSREAVEIIRHLDVQSLRMESKNSLYRSVPELGRLDRSMRGVARSGELLLADESRYSSRANRRDQGRRLARHARDTAAWYRFFKDENEGGEDGADVEPTAPEIYVERRYQNTGMAGQRAIRGVAVKALLDQADSLNQDASQKDDIAVQSQALTAKASVETMNASTEMLELKHQEIYMEDKKQAEAQAHQKAWTGFLGDNSVFLLSPPESP